MGILIEMEQYYCITCKKLFKERINKPYYTYKNFIDNQISILFGRKRKHIKKVPINIVNCPFCHSNFTLAVAPIIEKMKQPTNKGINQYNKATFTLYKEILNKLKQQKI